MNKLLKIKDHINYALHVTLAESEIRQLGKQSIVRLFEATVKDLLYRWGPIPHIIFDQYKHPLPPAFDAAIHNCDAPELINRIIQGELPPYSGQLIYISDSHWT
ncbi:1844_t:CDS:1 [Paraglomus brasilianum]|uniref:1844_t:CDS:1 n=1 Tax=Paraglomus brasilianum TaxID=144538 RepID=A0A9N9A224_9GLOM|nr:1844_t:CDS:1 [Paraglomus brasilianum]